MNSLAASEALSASANISTALPGFEVNTYDRDGNPVLTVGRFDSIAAARGAIAAHAGAELDENTLAGSVLPSIVESWFFGPVEYIVHCLA